MVGSANVDAKRAARIVRVAAIPHAAGELPEGRPVLESPAREVEHDETLAVLHESLQPGARRSTGGRTLPVHEVEQDDVELREVVGAEKLGILDDLRVELAALAQNLAQRGRGTAPIVPRLVIAGDDQDTNGCRIFGSLRGSGPLLRRARNECGREEKWQECLHSNRSESVRAPPLTSPFIIHGAPGVREGKETHERERTQHSITDVASSVFLLTSCPTVPIRSPPLRGAPARRPVPGRAGSYRRPSRCRRSTRSPACRRASTGRPFASRCGRASER